jgi:hypothetical protein
LPFQLLRRRQHSEKIASVFLQHDGFCQLISPDARCFFYIA